MRLQPSTSSNRRLTSIFQAGTCLGLSDAELLDRFIEQRGEIAELAFAVLVERHGPMVLRTCRQVLSTMEDAEDAFQATFLILARRAHRIIKREVLAPWLYGVALRVASAARTASSRRQSIEQLALRQQLATNRHRSGNAPDPLLMTAIHEELTRLPDRFRKAIVLCCLEGLTYEEVARQLGWPIGTVKSRLARGRERLQKQLTRRGVAPAVALTASTFALGSTAQARVLPVRLVEITTQAATQFLVGKTTTVGCTSTAVATLTKGVLQTMLIKNVKIAGTALLFGTLVVTMTSSFTSRVAATLRSDPVPAPVSTQPMPSDDDNADQPGNKFEGMARKEAAGQLFGQLVDVREDLDKILKQLDALTKTPDRGKIRDRLDTFKTPDQGKIREQLDTNPRHTDLDNIHAHLKALIDNTDLDKVHAHLKALASNTDLDKVHTHLKALASNTDLDKVHTHLKALASNTDLDKVHTHLKALTSNTNLDKVHEHLEALTKTPTDRTTAKQLGAQLRSAEDRIRAIRESVEQITIEHRLDPSTPITNKIPSRTNTDTTTSRRTETDTEQRLRVIEKKLDELLDALKKNQ